MIAAAQSLATVLVIWIIGIEPYAFRRWESLINKRTATSSVNRQRRWTVAITLSWFNVGILAIVGVLANSNAASIGLTLSNTKPNAALIGWLFIAISTLVVGIGTLVMRRIRPKNTEIGRTLRRMSKGLPHGRQERWIFTAMAASAGIGEEILFRGFGIAYIRWLFPDAATVVIVIVIAITFGLAHRNQGNQSVAMNTLVGGVLTWVTLATGTLVPAIVVHTLLDLRFLFLRPDVVESSRNDTRPSKRLRRSVRTAAVGKVTRTGGKSWDGVPWESATSGDGPWRWDETHWVATSGDNNVPTNPASSSMWLWRFLRSSRR
jgi:membrane protease YdiL (CAAX protease family)